MRCSRLQPRRLVLDFGWKTPFSDQDFQLMRAGCEVFRNAEIQLVAWRARVDALGFAPGGWEAADCDLDQLGRTDFFELHFQNAAAGLVVLDEVDAVGQ